MGDIRECHPKFQKAMKKLAKLCAKEHIYFGIGECHRTVKEQDEKWAIGRTIPPIGKTVTNAKGINLSSMHQWYVAGDIYLKMDIDRDGKISDDAFNDDTQVFERIGQLAKKCGLEWGGGWTSIKDRPHFQLKDWGSTPYLLKKKYGTPEKFRKTWQKK